MARIFKDSSVLNQFGSPSLNSNTLANRPAFGQVGRLFVDTTNNVIYRDTGTSWVLVGGAGSTPNLQAVTGVGNTSSNGIFLGLTGSLDSGLIFEVSGYTRMDQTVASATNLGASNIKQFTFQTSGTTVATGNPSPDLNQLFVDIQVAQTVGGAGNLQIGAGLFENVISGTDNLLLTVTQTVGLSALAPIISYQRYINSGDSTITDTAGIVINGLQRTGAGVLNVTNNYQLLVNSSQQFATTSNVTNRYGIYQAGTNDNNYFAANIYNASKYIQLGGSVSSVANSFVIDLYNSANYRFQTYNGSDFLINPLANGVIIGGNTGFGQNLSVYGGIATNGTVRADNIGLSSNDFRFTYDSDGGKIQSYGSKPLILNNLGNNVLINTTTPTGRTLVINGNVEIITTTATGVHTPTAQHLPIYVNNVLYYLQLLN